MPKEYFKKLQDLLNTEREADLQSYLKLTENTSPADRRSLGLTWYPIAIRNNEIGRGDYLTVEVERTTHQDFSHQFRFGSSVVLFSNHDPKIDQLEGIITHQTGSKMKVNFRVDELPDWTRDGKLGVDLLFDNNSYDEMQSALKRASVLAEDDSENKLIRILTTAEKPSFQIEEKFVIPSTLNDSQRLAVNKIVTANHLAIVHGPPGTGKTTTLVHAIKSLIKHNNQKILVVAPSNTAVDLLTEKLALEGLNTIRIGNPARVSDRLLTSTLEHKMADHPDMKTVKSLKKQANEYKNMAHKYKRSFGKAERDQRKALFNEAHKIGKEVEKIEQYITDHLFDKAQIITATLVGANHYSVRNLKYNTVVIDEAGQALEPACWIPILKAEKIIFAGDHFQLSPTIKSQEAGSNGLSKTLLEKLIDIHPESVVLLNEQYRMHQNIMGYSSKVFYQNQLNAHQSVASHLIFDDDEPLVYIDTAGCSFDEKLEGTSTINPDEAAFLVNHLTSFVKEVTSKEIDNFPSIAIISPYKQQVQYIKALVEENEALISLQNKISVNTIDSFQGQERDVVYISLTRSNSDAIIGFLSDTRRMNVAMTRARKKLVVIGDSATLSKAKFYADFIEYADKLGVYHSAWEFINS
ncbi:DNA helicase [Pedobacter sp. Leaf41]|uniref:AAA domain-containing protein n=1 Tax=Pedobacter sp. Leaf41 TaxID=1736218 RepID=UPI0007035134|nr:AAA domain-containing protein [Pedobacter sp. Leaf41]KQN38778.1 DNA helicase [Pedobacter sp. Leaf41]RZK66941.1 MAG: IGHMBP2 family helicase [Pedobacter sp.]